MLSASQQRQAAQTNLPDATWNVADAAAWYARELEWPVFPVALPAKRPLTPNGHHDATTDPAQIKAWWQKWPNAGIGLPCGLSSGVAVIDIDVKNGAPGLINAQTLAGKHGDYSSYLASRTPSKGAHHFYPYAELPFASNAGKAAGGIDLRSSEMSGASSGYVVLPPSFADPDKPYEWRSTELSALATFDPSQPVIPHDVALAFCFSEKERLVIASTPGMKQRLIALPRTQWRNQYNLDRTFSTDGLRLLAPGAKPRTGVGLDHRYIETAIEGELESIACAKRDQNDNLSRRASSIGTILGGLGFNLTSPEAKSVRGEVIKAALAMASLDPSNPWDSPSGRRAIEATVDGQLDWGIRNPRDLSHLKVRRDGTEDTENADVQSAENSPAPASAPRNKRVAQLISMAEVEAKPIEWLWPKRIPKGALSIIAGDPSQGKSQITCYMAATISTGRAWVDDERKKTRDAQTVILLNAEDAAETVIKPRLLAAEADVSKVLTIKSVLKYDDKGNPTETDMSLAQDIQTLDAALTETGDVGLVVIDPISAYLGKVDSHNNSEVRGILAPLARLAEKHNVAMVCVSHLNKGSGGKVTDRVTGSLAFSAAARAVYLVGASPEPDEADDTTKMFVAGKTNLAPNVEALSFKIESALVPTAAGLIETSRVQWLAAMTMTADEVLRGKDEKRDGRKEGKEVLTTWLATFLADGYWHPFEKIDEAAKRAGHDKSKSTFLRAAKSIGVDMQRPAAVGEAGSEWRLPKRH